MTTLDDVGDWENPGWWELVFTVWVRADFEETWRWWRRVSARQVGMHHPAPQPLGLRQLFRDRP